jgi:hypothetical protein
MLEYSAIISPVIRASNFNTLNIIQNKAIKIVNRKSIYSSLHEINTDIEDLNDRFDILNKKYIRNAIINNNELVKEACFDYLEVSQHRVQSYKTILCNYKEDCMNFVGK